MRVVLVGGILCLLTLFSTSAAFAQSAGEGEAAALRVQADAACAHGLYAQAIDLFTRMIQLDPHDSLAYRGRGWASGELGKYDAAIAYESMAIQLAPNDAVAYTYRGNIYLCLGHDEQAVADFDNAIKLDPHNALAYRSRGRAYGDLDKYALEIADETRAIKLNPTDAYAYAYRGWAYGNSGQYYRAIADCDIAIKLAPHDADAHHHRGWAYENLGKHEAAIADETTALQEKPNNFAALLNRGRAYANLGKYDLAIEDETRAIALNPHSAYAFTYRGWAYLNEGHYEPAIADCNTAINLDPGFPGAYAVRTWADAKRSRASDSAPQQTYTIPFELYKRHIFVSARIGNGKTSYHFMVDTGFNTTAISASLASQLPDVIALGEARTITDAYGATGKSTLCQVDSIMLDDCPIRNPFSCVMDLQPLESALDREFDGILGASSFWNYRVTIDYPHRTITLSPSATPLNGDNAFKAVDPESTGKLAMPITVDSQTLFVEPDTGAGRTSLPLSFLQTLHNDQEDKVACIGGTFAGVLGVSDVSEMMIRLQQFDIGQCRLHNFLADSLRIDRGVLGEDVLSQFIVTLDYPNQVIALTPIAHQRFYNNWGPAFGFTARNTTDGLKISGLWENSPAAMAGLQPGDKILKVNGQPADGNSLQQLVALEKDEQVTSVTLQIESEGKERQVTIGKGMLFPPVGDGEQEQ